MIKDLAAEWTKDKREPSDKLRALQDKLADRFNFVNFDATWQPPTVRPASDLIECNYGLPVEAGALLLSLARAANLDVQPAIVAKQSVWLDGAPQDSMVAAYVVVLDGPEPEIWDAHHGHIVRDAHWAGHVLLQHDGQKLQQTVWPAWTAADESRCHVDGEITIDDQGEFAGEVIIRTTGLFVAPESLRTNDDQNKRVSALVEHVLPAAKVESFSVSTLATHEFEVTAKIKSSEPLRNVGEAFCLQLAEDGPYAADVPLPLSHSTRRNPVWLTGAFDTEVALAITWPEGWTVDASPQSVTGVAGTLTTAKQECALAGNRLTVMQQTRVSDRELSPEEFLPLRGALNELRSEYARTLLLRP